VWMLATSEEGWRKGTSGLGGAEFVGILPLSTSLRVTMTAKV
jgi:hypothetical protein